ncbi:uncharacterized protein [Hemitrygon akajei]|uniref:uncharacterized protein isoform X3 n=1 Tax=Hemitrygon akajei TaxID=2704970 RepID=UPI003BF9F5A4
MCSVNESRKKAEREEVVGVLGSSVLLDPEITVDSSKNEILWTFKASNKSHDVILDHIPGVATLEPSEQFKDRLQFNAANGALMINHLEASDEGNYTYSVDSKELKIIQLLVIDKMEEVIGILGSSVLLDPKIKVDPNKNDVLWTFIGSNKSLEIVLDHIPGLTMEPSEQFKNRSQFFASSGGLMINSLKASDQGDYTFTVDGRELKVIQLFLHEKMKEVIGILNSSVLLDPELEVDPSKNEIVWTFIGNSILHHVPDQKTTEYSEQFESRLKFNTSNGVLTVNGLTPGDQGNYSFIVNEQEMKILQLLIFEKLSNASIFIDSYSSLGFTVQLTCDVDGDADEFQWQKDGGEISQRHRLTDGNMTLVIQHALVSDCGSYTCVAKNPISSIRGNRSIILIGLSNNDAIVVFVLTAGLVICSASLHPAMLLDDWKLKTQGVLGITFYFLSIAVCHTVADVAFLAVVFYWSYAQGLSPLVVVTSSTLITGLLLSSLNINTFIYLPWTRTSNQEIIRRIKIWFNWLSISKVVLVFCIMMVGVLYGIVTGFSKKDNASAAVGIVALLGIVLISLCIFICWKNNTDQGTNWIPKRILKLRPICITCINFIVFIVIAGDVLSSALSLDGNAAVALLITGLMLPLMFLIPLMYLLLTPNLNKVAALRVRRWLSIYNPIFLFVGFITMISWMVITGFTREDIVIVTSSVMGLVLSAANAITFLFWTWKEFPGDKCWRWSLNICNVVSLVSILIAFICWIVFKGERCDSNIPIWILLIVSMPGCVITLFRTFLVWHCKSKETNTDNSAEGEQDSREMNELQNMNTRLEAEPR